MIHLFLPKNKFFPINYFKSIYDVDYNKLYESGVRLILTDLDNTLISYRETEPAEKLIHWKRAVEDIGFKIIIVSNSGKDRVSHFAEMFGVKYVFSSLKPFKKGFKKALKNEDYTKDEVVFFGDQLMTDIYGANRMNLNSYLFEAIDKKTEILPTRINRYFEKRLLQKIKKKYPEKFNEGLVHYYEEHF